MTNDRFEMIDDRSTGLAPAALRSKCKKTGNEKLPNHCRLPREELEALIDSALRFKRDRGNRKRSGQVSGARVFQSQSAHARVDANWNLRAWWERGGA